MFTAHLILISSLFFSFLDLTLADIGLTGQDFLVDSSARNVKLSWNSVSGVTSYVVRRKSGTSDYQVVARVNATSYDDYGIPPGPHTYQVLAAGSINQISNELTRNPPESNWLNDMKSYDNTVASTLEIRSRIKMGGTFYRYSLEGDRNGANQIVESSSSDGYTFSGERVVLTRQQICGLRINGFCKLESLSFVQHPTTSEIVLWAHWEELRGYGKGNVAVAFGHPGGSWTFGGFFRPLGHDSRDLTFFADDDGSGYIISSTRSNSDMNIYKLSNDWHRVVKLVATVLKGEFREAPAMIHEGGTYYLFTSRAAGWYPSPGKYISAKKISGPWSESRFIGNLAGFGAQSGRVIKLGSSWVMCANKWKTGPQAPPHRQILLPISLENGYAAYYFYPSILYLDDDHKGGVYGVQKGKILSVGKDVLTSEDVANTGIYSKLYLGYPSSNAVRGINTNPANFYKPSKVPFTFQVDLGAAYLLTQIELTTLLISGSETCYQFKVEAASSAQGPFKQIWDESENVKVGFVRTSLVNNNNRFQFVKLKVRRVIDVQNQHNDMRVGVYEFNVYGKKIITR